MKKTLISIILVVCFALVALAVLANSDKDKTEESKNDSSSEILRPSVEEITELFYLATSARDEFTSPEADLVRELAWGTSTCYGEKIHADERLSDEYLDMLITKEGLVNAEVYTSYFANDAKGEDKVKEILEEINNECFGEDVAKEYNEAVDSLSKQVQAEAEKQAAKK